MVDPRLTPEAEARRAIDAMFVTAGWVVQSRAEMNLYAHAGVAVREFPLATGPVDYLLFVDQNPVGVLEAKPAGFTLSGVEGQSEDYSAGLPTNLKAPVRPLPFVYQSTGVETQFTNRLDPDAKARRVFSVHRPETLREWLAADTLDAWVKGLHGKGGLYTAADETRPSSLRARITTMPNLEDRRLYPNQVEAITNLERSLHAGRQRALIQMATGSGKTKMAISEIYRLIKFGGARRILFLVDRTNLGEQAELEFESYVTPDDNRKLSELYNVQRLTSNTIGASAKVVITTVQRLYSMLQGEPELDAEAEEGSSFERVDALMKEPLPVVYNATYPPEYFDFIVVDECHRSIYALWRQVLEYFDATLIGLTATPAKHTFGFFDGNLVMEYPHERAVADGVNVDFEVYQIKTKITEQGSTVEAGPGVQLGFKHRKTGRLRWEAPEEDFAYDAAALDRRVTTPDQIRTIIRTFRDKLSTEIFPGRTNVPKTLVFAKDDEHAENIVRIMRDEFGRGNDFCKKITYRTTGAKPKDLIQEFRTSFNPRIAVTVDMVATGTDIRPVEIVMFMRSVRSRVLFEQMKGRGVRIIDPNELKGVTDDATAKTHFVIVDCVGVTESELNDTVPLERKQSVSLRSLLEHVAVGGTDPDVLSSLASRLARMDRECNDEQRARVRTASGGTALSGLSAALLSAIDPDRVESAARAQFSLGPTDAVSDKQRDQAAESVAREAARPLAANPALRSVIADLKAELELVVDAVSRDSVLFAGVSDDAKAKARGVTASFEQYLRDNADEIAALRFYYSRPHAQRPTYDAVKALAEAIKAPPRSWTPEMLWRAYELLDGDKVRGASSRRLLTDIVSLVRFAIKKDEQLVPYPDLVRARFAAWMEQQGNGGRRFTRDQQRWLEMIRDHIATSVEISMDDFDLAPFVEQGGVGAARNVFGAELPTVVKELNEVLAA